MQLVRQSRICTLQTSGCFNPWMILLLQPIDKQSLLDSGILCCLIHILSALLGPDEGNQKQKASTQDIPLLAEKNYDREVVQVRLLEVVSFSCLPAFYLLWWTRIYVLLFLFFGQFMHFESTPLLLSICPLALIWFRMIVEFIPIYASCWCKYYRCQGLCTTLIVTESFLCFYLSKYHRFFTL